MVVRVTLPWLLLLLLMSGCGGGSDNTEPVAADPVNEEPLGEATVDPIRRANIELYFPSALENGLVGEYHEIFDTITPEDRIKQIIADLIGGPQSQDALRSLPPGTRLRQAFVLENGTAYLDFSAELSESLGGGSQQELLAVYSIIDSVALNVSEVRRVGILINGQPIETLNGHLDLRRPLPPDNRWILGSVVVVAELGAFD